MSTNHTFFCPHCKRELIENSINLRCPQCLREFKSSNGIYSFNEYAFYWNQIPHEKMVKLNEIAEQKGWKTAIDTIIKNNEVEYFYNYIVDETRADWHFMLPIKSDDMILDIGCGWGAVYIQLSRYYKNIIGADTTRDTLEFLKIRADQEGIEQSTLIHIDPLDYGSLPFPDSHFDFVIMNGLLEWVGTSRLDLSPEECQKIALEEVKRILKPSGKLYIGIENRLSYTCFLSVPTHSIRFADVMPRKMADVICKMLGKKDGFRTYTYSYWGYKKLLKKSGFDNIDFYFPFPSYRDPFNIFHENDRVGLNYFINNFIESKTKKLLLQIMYMLHLEKVFIYSFGIVAGIEK